MDVLIDTHILVCRESDRSLNRHLLEVLRILNESKCRIVIHPLSVLEIEKDKNVPNKDVLLDKVKSYPVISVRENPNDDDEFMRLMKPPKSPREQTDHHLLHCVYRKKVDYFLTEDPELHDKADVLNISDKTKTLKEALQFFTKTPVLKKIDAPIYFFYSKGDI